MYYMIEILGGEVTYTQMLHKEGYNAYYNIEAQDDGYFLLSIF